MGKAAEAKSAETEKGPNDVPNYLAAIKKSEVLNTMTKGDLKKLSKSKDTKAREFVLGKEEVERQQAIEEAKAAKAAEKAEREARKAEQQAALEKKIGSNKAFKATTSTFAALDDEPDEVEEKKQKTKKQMRRSGRKKKNGEDDHDSSSRW